MSLKHFLTKQVHNLVWTTTTKKDYISSNWKKTRENKLNQKIGWTTRKIGVLCFAYFTLASAKSPCFLTKEPDLRKGSQYKSTFALPWLCSESSEGDCELQTPAEARFWVQKLSYCYTSGFLLHKFSSRFCVNRSCLMRVFLQKFIFKQYAAPSTESFFCPSFHFHSFTKSFNQHIKNADLV